MHRFFDVQSLLKHNSKIVNAQPHHWHTIRRLAVKDEAQRYLDELRKGARTAKLPYRYRLKIINEASVTQSPSETLENAIFKRFDTTISNGGPK